MRTILFVFALLLVPLTARATGVVGESVIYRYNSTHYYLGILTADNGDGSYGLVVFDPDDYMTNWPFGPNSQGAFATIAINGVYEDESNTTDNRWRANPAIGLGAQGPQGDPGATGATGATGPQGPTGATGPGALVTATSSPSLTIGGSATQFSASRDVEYTATVKISNTLTVSGGSAGHVDLVCDSSSSPTTVVETVSAENTGTLTLGLTMVQSVTSNLRWRAPAGHYCKLTSTNDTGTPTYTLIRQFAQTLGS